MQTTRLSSKGQLILPKTIRDAHGWHPGIEFVLVDQNEGVFLKPMNPHRGSHADQLLGCLNYKGRKKTLKQMEEGIAKGAKRA